MGEVQPQSYVTTMQNKSGNLSWAKLKRARFIVLDAGVGFYIIIDKENKRITKLCYNGVDRENYFQVCSDLWNNSSNAFISRKSKCTLGQLAYAICMEHTKAFQLLRSWIPTLKSVTIYSGRCKIYYDYMGNSFPSFAFMCEFYGLPMSTVDKRLRSGWPLEKALTIPKRSYRSAQHK